MATTILRKKPPVPHVGDGKIRVGGQVVEKKALPSGHFSYFATTAKGMEDLLKKEIAELGKPCGVSFGTSARAGVRFEGPIELAYRVCLGSRIANRVLLPLDYFPAPAPEKLYAGVKKIRWSDHMTPQDTLAVDFSSLRSEIAHTQFGALKVKDAIVDQLRSIHGERPSIDTKRPDIRVNVYLQDNFATVALDLSGASLHQRGYREDGRYAPLKENLAAAILMSAGWDEICHDPQAGLVDPMCGSGTLVAEAALMAARVAPGLLREYYGFLAWKHHDPAVYEKVYRELEAAVVTDKKKLPMMVGFDTDGPAITAALANWKGTGLPPIVHFERRALEGAEPPPHTERGLFIVNPPYGERLGEEEKLIPLYRQIGHVMKQRFKGWKAGIFTGSSVLAKETGLKPSRRIVLYNGAIECRLLTFELYAGTRKTEKPEPKT